MENSISSDLIRGHIDTIILYSLINGDKFAQQISDYVFEKSEKKYEINQATLYSSLKRLENLSFVKAYWNDAQFGRRRYFSLTQKGNDFINENLSNWSYSRSIIDKLLGSEQNSVFSVNESVKKENEKIDVKVEEKNEVSSQKTVISNEKPPISNEKSEEKNEQEVNFRNILNGLISVTKVVSTAKPESVEKTKDVEVKIDLKQEIEKDNKNVKQNRNIDLSSLEISASKEGYKIRFSNTKPRIEKGSIIVNKLNVFTSLFVSILALIEFLLISIFGKNYVYFSTGSMILATAICIIPSIIFDIIYFIKPFKTCKNVKISGIFTALIVFFDFILLLFVIEWLLGLDFTNLRQLILFFLLPCLVVFDTFIFVYLRYLLSKRKFFEYNK